jgi:hypothetical protein
MLDSYSAQALATLQQLMPDLAAQAKQEEDYFVINVISPSGFELWLSSAEKELTVGFAEHHCHFGWHEGDPQEDAEAATAYVQKLCAGQLEIAAWYEGEHFVGSVTREVGHTHSLTWFQRWWRRKQHLVLRRWVA